MTVEGSWYAAKLLVLIPRARGPSCPETWIGGKQDETHSMLDLGPQGRVSWTVDPQSEPCETDQSAAGGLCAIATHNGAIVGFERSRRNPTGSVRPLWGRRIVVAFGPHADGGPQNQLVRDHFWSLKRLQWGAWRRVDGGVVLEMLQWALITTTRSTRLIGRMVADVDYCTASSLALCAAWFRTCLAVCTSDSLWGILSAELLVSLSRLSPSSVPSMVSCPK